ncbi:sodium:solute symporter family protein [Rapidithrix thailandica]|uniref:Sodium:solute symporter family protein n=1 Tax=Rapidithrix thailandica TaxID=413964 RepID=A0AAW9S082_9BACT
MQLNIIDIGIIILYLALTILIGFIISKKASKNLDSYFLGGKSIPWYALGISNASGMFDITGTMWMVYLLFVYGVKSAWLPWLWPIFNQIFLMVYLSRWLRKSNVMTGAEWIQTRFGNGPAARLSNIIVIVFAIVSVIGFLAYAFQGIGKFAFTFLPKVIESEAFGTIHMTPNIYGVIFISITAIYVVKGGMYSVVLTEVLQFIIMTIASIAVGVIAINIVSPEQLSAIVPEGWYSLFFGWELDVQWDIAAINQKVQEDGYSLFALFFGMMVFKGILVSMAGPAPNYDMQRVLSTKSPAEAAKMSGFVSLVLFFPRYFLITGVAILGIVGLDKIGLDVLTNPDTNQVDFELVLPYVIQNYIPVGLLGLLLAGLLAAFMSTVAATTNAAPAYLVNDIYKKYINPHGSAKTYVRMSYLATVVVVLIGVGFGFATDSINQITQWIVNALFGGYAMANLLKWHWWRLNGYGYFWGMLAGIIASLFLPYLDVSMIPLPADVARFPIMLLISLIGCIAGSLSTPPQDEEELKDFYRKIQPWGWWKPIHNKVLAEDPTFQKESHFKQDGFNILTGVVWQTSLVVMPIYIVIQDFTPAIIAFGIFFITSLILKFNWYDKLKKEKPEKVNV